MFANQELLLYIIIAILIAIAFSMKKLYSLELAIERLEESINRKVIKPKKKAKKR